MDLANPFEMASGKSVVDFWDVTGRTKNVAWVHAVDAESFFDLLSERLARL